MLSDAMNGTGYGLFGVRQESLKLEKANVLQIYHDHGEFMVECTFRLGDLRHKSRDLIFS